MSNTITNKQVSDIVEQIALKYDPDKIVLYGSYARGAPSKDSDLDLFIVKNGVNESGIERRWKLRKLIKKEKMPVDYIIVNQEEFKQRLKMQDPFLKTILNEGKVVYSKQDDKHN